MQHFNLRSNNGRQYLKILTPPAVSSVGGGEACNTSISGGRLLKNIKKC